MNDPIRCKVEAATVEKNPSHLTSCNRLIRNPQHRSEVLGRLHGATLTERVMGFLERYNGPVYGLG